MQHNIYRTGQNSNLLSDGFPYSALDAIPPDGVSHNPTYRQSDSRTRANMAGIRAAGSIEISQEFAEVLAAGGVNALVIPVSTKPVFGRNHERVPEIANVPSPGNPAGLSRASDTP